MFRVFSTTRKVICFLRCNRFNFFNVKTGNFVAILFIATLSSSAQEFDPGYLEYHTKFVPPTPNASTFTIYGDVPVNNATGIPQISIPLFTIEEDGVAVPVSLSYHASGVKVDDLAGVVGLKWTLNAGGGIFRQVNDKVDEEGWLDPNKRGIVNPTWLAAQGPNPLADNQVQNAINYSAENHDYYPDDFNYNFLGNSGNFIFNLQGQVEDEYYSTMQITKVANGPLSFDFVGRDGRGNTYYFDTFHESNRKNVLTGSPHTGNLNFDSDALKTGWMLNEIVTRNNQIINFTYVPYDLEYTLNNISTTIAHARTCSAYYFYFPCGCMSDGNNPGYEYTTDFSSTDIIYDSRNQLISTIETEDILVTFNYSDDNTLSTWQRKLTSVVILDKIGNKNKSFNFVYGKFSGDPRLRLEQVQEIGFDGSSKPSFKFFYETGDLPDKGNYSKDFFGYYNGENNTSLVPFTTTAYNTLNTLYRGYLSDRIQRLKHLKKGTLNKIEYPTGGSTEFIYEANSVPDPASTNIPYKTYSAWVSTQAYVSTSISGSYTLFRAPFTINENIMGSTGTPVNHYGSSDICDYDPQYPNIDCSRFNIYPRTGNLISGPAIFDPDHIIWGDGSINLESGDYMLELIVESSQLYANPNANIQIHLNWMNPDDSIEKTKYTGGLRVKSIVDKDVQGEILKQANYSYEDLTGYTNDISNTIKEYGDKTVFSSEVQSINPSVIRSGYLYGKVIIDKKGSLVSNEVIRTIEFYEDIYHKKSLEPQMVRQEMYQASQIVKSIDFDYTNTILDTEQYWVLGMKDYCYNMAAEVGGIITTIQALGFNQPDSQTYSFRKNFLSQTTEIDYLHEPGDPFVCAIKIQKFQYNDDLLPIRAEMDGRYYALSQQDIDTDNLSLAAEGEHIIVETTYPVDHIAQESGFSTMNTNYLVNFPVSKKVYNHNELILGQFMEYDTQGNVHATYRYNKGVGTNNSSLNYIPSNYELNNTYTILNGKAVEIKTADGPPTSLLWDTSYKYLLAELQNVSWANLNAELNGQTIPDINDSQQLNTLYTSLRNAFPNGRINTYVYDPLRGVGQIGDPRDQRTDFIYDGLGRLKETRDKEGHLLSSYEYHYLNHNN